MSLLIESPDFSFEAALCYMLPGICFMWKDEVVVLDFMSTKKHKKCSVYR